MNARLKSLALYAGAVVLCLVLLTYNLRLWRADLRVPFVFLGDVLWTLACAKGVLDNGWYLHNGYLGAPGVMDLHDFPFADSLFFLIIKLLCLLTRDATFAYNLFYLLTFPLTTLTSLFVLRRLQIAAGPAIVASLLYTFLPYHLLRGEGHLFLASYFLVPLAILVVLRVFMGPAPRSWIGPVIVCVLMGCGGVYYAFFTCFFLAIAGVTSSLHCRRLYPLMTAGLLCVVVSLTVGANLVPTYIYHRQHGSNREATERSPDQADQFGLKVAQLLLPIDRHRLRCLARLKERYNESMAPGFNENSFCTLGLVGSVGFLLLLARVLYRRAVAPTRPVDGVTTLNAAALMLACIGCGGSLFAVYASPSIRGYNRISVFIAFFALFAVARLLDRHGQRVRSPRARWLYRGGLTALLVLGNLDQVPRSMVPPYRELKEAYQSDADLVARMEATLPPGSMIFQLPAIPFPEGPINGYFGPYDHFRPYLHSHTLRWSHGTMRGREGDRWREGVAEKPLPELVRIVIDAGFRGIFVDRAFYDDLGGSVEAELTRLLGAKPIASPQWRFYFYDLTAYAARLQRETAAHGPSPGTTGPAARRSQALPEHRLTRS